MSICPSLDSKNECANGRETRKAEAQGYDFLPANNADATAAPPLASGPPEFDEIGSDASVEWARRTLTRFHEIWTGYALNPNGWSDWKLQVGVDHTGMRAVTASAARRSGAFADVSFKIADMVSPGELNSAIREFFHDLKEAGDLREPLGHLAKQPVPFLPDWLIAKLEEDIGDEAPRRFNEARSVLGAGRQCSRSTAASR